MNEYDSNRIFDSVKDKLVSKTANLFEETACYLFNTCHIRDKVKIKFIIFVGRVKKV